MQILQNYLYLSKAMTDRKMKSFGSSPDTWKFKRLRVMTAISNMSSFIKLSV